MDSKQSRMKGVSKAKDVIVFVISLSLFLYPLLCGIIGTPAALVFRPVYLAMLLVLTIFVQECSIFNKEIKVLSWILNILLALGAVGCIWVAKNWHSFQLKYSFTTVEFILAISLALASMEVARRTPCRSLNYVAIFAIAYALFGKQIPGFFGHAGLTVSRLLRGQIFTTDGLFGTPISSGATFIGLFVFFSAFLEASGGMAKFMNFAMAAAGRLRGGPAKIAVIASAMMGMISGSAVTNVVTTGVITIPLMKRIGYKDSFAGGVEATASLGSQITPPIMGATAFLICEMTGETYLRIMSVAIIPCILYYACVFMQVHLASIKFDIGGMKKEDLPNLKQSAIELLPFVIPIVLLVILLVLRYSTSLAISFAIFSFFAICLVSKSIRPQFLANFKNAIVNGAKSLISLTASLAVAGIIIGILTMSGLGDKLSYLIEMLANGNIHLIIILTAVVCMILGMGMVTVGAYVLVAALTAPLMVSYGVPLLAAHFFIFYYAVMSAISPPVMVSVFAASSISGAKPMSTAVQALRLAFAGFVVPLIFIYSPDLLFLDGFSLYGVLYVVTSLLGLIAFSIAFEGHSFYQPENGIRRVFYALFGALTILPNVWTSILGTVCVAAFLIVERGKKTALPA